MNAPVAAARSVNVNVPYPFPRATSDVVLKRGSPRPSSSSTITAAAAADTRWDAYNLDAATTRPSPFCRQAVLDFQRCMASRYEFRFGSVCDEFRDYVHCFLAPLAATATTTTTTATTSATRVLKLAPMFCAPPPPAPPALSFYVLSQEVAGESVRLMVHGADPADRGPVYKTPAADGSSSAPDFVAWRVEGTGVYVAVAQADFRRWLDSVPHEQRRTWLRSSTDMFQTDTATDTELVYDATSRLQYAIVPLDELPTPLYTSIDALMSTSAVLAVAAAASGIGSGCGCGGVV